MGEERYAEAEVLATSHATDSLTGLFNMPFFYQQGGGNLQENPQCKGDK